MAVLTPDHLGVAPGDTASLALTVSNTGSVVDEVEVTVAGPLAAYTTVVPASIPVYPGDKATAQVTVRPPHAVSPPAGSHPVVLRVASNRGGSVSEHVATVEIGAFSGMTVRLVPPHSRGRSGRFSCSVEVGNQGNSVLQVTVAPRDDNGRVRWPRGPQGVRVAPGATAHAGVQGRTRLNWFGDPDSFPFDVTVGASAEPAGRTPPLAEKNLPGTREQLAVLAGWQVWLLVLAGLAAALAVVAFIVGPVLVDAGRTVVDQVREAIGGQEDPVDTGQGEQEEAPPEEGEDDPGDPAPQANAQFCLAAAEARTSLEAQGLDRATLQELQEVLQLANGDVDDRLTEQAGIILDAANNGDTEAVQSALDEVASLCGG